MLKVIYLEELEKLIKENIKSETPEDGELVEWCKDECIRLAHVLPSVNIVRCRDCELCAINTVLGTFRCWRFKSIVNPNDFCNYGRRQTECGNGTQTK